MKHCELHISYSVPLTSSYNRIFRHLNRFLVSIKKTVILVINLKSLDFFASKEFRGIYLSTNNHRSNPWRFPKGLPPRTVEPLAADAPGLPALEMTTEALRELITKWTVESSSDHRGLQGLRNGGRTWGKNIQW